MECIANFLLYPRRCSRSERLNRHTARRWKQGSDLQKIGTKVVSPGGDAMRLVHYELDNGKISEKGPKTWVAQAFWRDVQEPEATVSCIGERLLLIHCGHA